MDEKKRVELMSALALFKNFDNYLQSEEGKTYLESLKVKARMLKLNYDFYIAAGFTSIQALDLCKAELTKSVGTENPNDTE